LKPLRWWGLGLTVARPLELPPFNRTQGYCD
jgi:hypothetical protein